MKRLILLISLFVSGYSIAQQDAIYSQYMFNQFAINPAYAGSRDAANISFINRNQWVGIEGAPITQSVSAHVPIIKNSLAWGVNLSHDQLGPSRNILALGTIAYRLRLEIGTLNFGLRSGFYNSILDHGRLNFKEANDIVDNKQRLSSMVPTFDFGMYYYTERFYVGLSSNHITKHRFNFESLQNNQAYYLRRHTFLTLGYVFKLNKKLMVKPSCLLKHASETGFNADLNANVMFNELFWLGIGVRNLSSLNFLVDFNVTDYIRIGYAYDMTLNKIKNYSNGSHEVLIGFDFNTKKGIPASPRYL